MTALAKLSLQNWWATATVFGTTAIAGYPLTNVRDPGRPFLPYRSNTTGETAVYADFTVPRLVELACLFNCNFTQAYFQADALNDWAPPEYSSPLLTVTVNQWNGRYTHAHLLPAGGTTHRYTRWVIPAHAPTDGASHFEIGGVWAGPVIPIPRGWRWGYDIDPREDERRLTVRAELGQWENTYATGDLATRLRATRQVSYDTADVAAFRALDRAWVTGGLAALWLNLGNTADAWVMRAHPGPWRFGDDLHPTSDIELEEVLAG